MLSASKQLSRFRAVHGTHDNSHRMAFRLEPFGEFASAFDTGICYLQANLGERAAQHLLEPRSKLTSDNMAVMGIGREDRSRSCSGRQS